jgi:hypothetical protein
MSIVASFSSFANQKKNIFLLILLLQTRKNIFLLILLLQTRNRKKVKKQQEEKR